jgi:hypothetical protein
MVEAAATVKRAHRSSTEAQAQQSTGTLQHHALFSCKNLKHTLSIQSQNAAMLNNT